jgi:aminoglycoside phosphotransferase (APT) family kinase protein
MRQSEADRAEYYRQLRRTISSVLVPELSSAQAIDAAALLDRILAQFIVEEEAASELSAEFGGELAALLDRGSEVDRPVVSPARFDALRARAADVVARPQAPGETGLAVMDIERRFLERVDELRCAVLAEGRLGGDPELPAHGCSVTTDQVTEYLRGRLPHSPDVVVERMSVVPGGRSKETILVSLRGTSELPGEVILRKDRPVGLLETRAADEFAVLGAIHEFGGVPVPEPFFAELEGNALGDGTFLVMERVAGHKAGEFFPDLAAPAEHHVALGQQLASSLARLHSMPLDRLGHTRLDLHQTAVTRDATVGMVEAILARLDGLSGPPNATAHVAGQWLLAHADDVVPSSRLCLLQGDFGFHNMLVDGARVTALVDWEAASIGPPARELAAAWSVATFLMGWPAFVAAYVDAGGPAEDTDPGAIRYYRVLLALGGLMTSKMGGHLFRTGAKRDLLTAHSGLDSYFRCARNLARAMSDAVSAAD